MSQTSRKSLKVFTSIDTTAFTSVLVVAVLILLLVSWTQPPHHSTSVDTPIVSRPVAMPGALRDDAIQVFVTRDSGVYLGSEQVAPADLAERIRNRLRDRGVERKVYIRADARARYDAVKGVLDGARDAGILRVAFLVDKRRLSVS